MRQERGSARSKVLIMVASAGVLVAGIAQTEGIDLPGGRPPADVWVVHEKPDRAEALIDLIPTATPTPSPEIPGLNRDQDDGERAGNSDEGPEEGSGSGADGEEGDAAEGGGEPSRGGETGSDGGDSGAGDRRGDGSGGDDGKGGSEAGD